MSNYYNNNHTHIRRKDYSDSWMSHRIIADCLGGLLLPRQPPPQIRVFLQQNAENKITMQWTKLTFTHMGETICYNLIVTAASKPS